MQHERGAIGRAEDDAELGMAMIGNDHRERAGEFARFSAQLQVTPAGIRRPLGNAHAFDDLVGAERRLKDPGRELGAFDRPAPARAADGHLGIQRRQNGGPFGSGVGQCKTAADRAASTDRPISERRRDPGHQAARRVSDAPVLDRGMCHARAEDNGAAIVGSRAQLGQSADIDQQAR